MLQLPYKMRYLLFVGSQFLFLEIEPRVENNYFEFHFDDH